MHVQGAVVTQKNVLAVTSLSILVAVGTAFAQSLQRLNMLTGLWQINETITWTGLPPQLQALLSQRPTHSYQSCVTKDDLGSNPWQNGSGEHCTWSVLQSSATDLAIQGTACDFGKDMGLTAQVHGTIHLADTQDGSGSFDVTMSDNGQNISGHASYTGKWVGATCPAP
jgi:Protein of unknown function (DUF3617)